VGWRSIPQRSFAKTPVICECENDDGRMKFALALPHTMELKALTQPWEFSVTGAD